MPTKKKKRDRFNGMSEDEVMKRELPDHLHENLDILIVRTAKKINGTWIHTAYLWNTHSTLILYLLYELWYIFLKNQKSMKCKVIKDIQLTSSYYWYFIKMKCSVLVSDVFGGF